MSTAFVLEAVHSGREMSGSRLVHARAQVGATHRGKLGAKPKESWDETKGVSTDYAVQASRSGKFSSYPSKDGSIEAGSQQCS